MYTESSFISALAVFSLNKHFPCHLCSRIDKDENWHNKKTKINFCGMKCRGWLRCGAQSKRKSIFARRGERWKANFSMISFHLSRDCEAFIAVVCLLHRSRVPRSNRYAIVSRECSTCIFVSRYKKLCFKRNFPFARLPTSQHSNVFIFPFSIILWHHRWWKERKAKQWTKICSRKNEKVFKDYEKTIFLFMLVETLTYSSSLLSPSSSEGENQYSPSPPPTSCDFIRSRWIIRGIRINV